jgi:hypothetical protein
MRSDAKTVSEYIGGLPADRKDAFIKLRKTILDNLPKGFEETISYGMVGYVVPHSIYPKGYRPNPQLPLPFVNLANQKKSINLYHNGVYADKELLEWFTGEYPKHTDAKLDMGKSCIRFNKINNIPYKLIGELMQKISVKKWIDIYEGSIKNTP